MKRQIVNSKYGIIHNYFYLVKSLVKYNKKIIVAGIIEIISSTLVPIGGIILPAFIVGVIEKQFSISVLVQSVICFFLIYGLCSAIQGYFKNRNEWQYIQFRVSYYIKRILNQCVDMNYETYENENTQKLLNNAMEACTGNQIGVERVLHLSVQLYIDLLLVIGYLFFLLRTKPWIAILLLCTSIFQILIYSISNNFEIRKSEERAQAELNMNYLERQAYKIENGKDIRLFQLQNWLISKYEKANHKYNDIISQERKWYFLNDITGVGLQFLRNIICYLYLLRLLENGLSLTAFVLYLGIITSCSGYFEKLTETFSELIRHLNKIDFIRDYLAIEDNKKLQEGKKHLEIGPIRIEFQHVSFAYNNCDQFVLKDVSFVIEKGEKVALVGVNGAGKSTLVKLLCGLYKVSSGKILINGVDINEYDDIKKDIAVVFQDSLVLADTIATNISCSNEYDSELARTVMKDSEFESIVEKLNDKEYTYLGKDINEQGIQLSGGQSQKLMLARALYKNGKMLILDEPTAALDAISENRLYEKYSELMEGMTSLFISHRLASTRFCDKIMLLKDGKISEIGTHKELIENHSDYAKMYQMQSQYYGLEKIKYE